MKPSRRKSSRREFLRGQTAVGELQDLAEGLAIAQPTESYLVRLGRRAMACEFEVLLNAGQYPHGTEAALAALDLVDQLEAQLSVFRDDSEVSRLNQAANDRWFEVEPNLFALLQQAAKIHRETEGAYDVTSGPLTKTWGFYRREGRVPRDAELTDAMLRVGMHKVFLDVQRHAVRFGTPGMEVNLGSIGKGYALDRAAELLAAAGVEDFLLHGGNSSVIGRGTSQTPHSSSVRTAEGESRGGWWIGLQHPLKKGQRIGEIQIHNRALGTSGCGTQFFEHEGRRYGHILDPRTGRPAEGLLSVTVAALSGAEADALATAFYVMGASAAIEYCRRHPEVSTVIMMPDGSEGQIDLLMQGWEPGQVQLYADASQSIRRTEC